MTDYIIRTNNLQKSYGKNHVISNVNLHIKKGEIYGFLGQNGAGKTTTLRILLGLVKPSKGEIFFNEKKISRFNPEVFEKIGSIIEFPGFYPNLTVIENLKLHLLLMGLNSTEAEIDSTLELFGILKYKHFKAKQLSLGTKQRLGIAKALIHKPELLILDEPLNGLDPIGIKEVREILLKLCKEKGITILISTHILSEVQQIANTIGIINNGELKEEINLEEMIRKSRKYIQIKVDNKNRACSILEKELNINNYHAINTDTIRIYDLSFEINHLTKCLIDEKITLYSIETKEDSLEDYFVNVTGVKKNA